MDRIEEVPIRPASLARFVPIVGAAGVARALEQARRLRESAQGRTIWNVNSTAVGGGVAEMLRSLLAYTRGTGVDARWLVIYGQPDFFRITKRLHNALHGEPGDGTELGLEARAIYEQTLRGNAKELVGRVRPGDVVLLHDPQTAGLAQEMLDAGARVIWRCHIGADERNAQTALGWQFLLPYLRNVRACVFSRAAFVPTELSADRVAVVEPSIDAFSAKNCEMPPAQVRAILTAVGLVRGELPARPPEFSRDDGSVGRVVHGAEMLELGPAPRWETPLVVQVSRWDTLKDPLGVMLGFIKMLDGGCRAREAELVLAGPTVRAVADDPDGPRVYGDIAETWRDLPHDLRRRVHLANLPMNDVEENGAIVNALQRHAAVVVQKSLREGFGLTVTEAMWKARPVVASAVGGIQDQIEDGVSGLLLRDPTNLGEYAGALRRVLEDLDFAERLGANARQRVIERFLGVRHLLQYAAIIQHLDGLVALSAPEGEHPGPAP